MNKNGPTSEFGICLIPDEASIDSIYELRQLLPTSPYRDDPPHITLLRGIKSQTVMSDSDLLYNIESLLHMTDALPLQAAVNKVDDGYSPRYGKTSVISFHTSSEMSTYRKDIAKNLKRNGYEIGIVDTLVFKPHISVRLGVPFNRTAQAVAEQRFKKDEVINFTKWVLFRIFYEDEKRLIKEISLDS